MTLLEMTKRDVPFSQYTDIHRYTKIFRDLKNGTQPSFPDDDVLKPIFLKCCDLNPTDRYASADEIRQAIENLTT